MRFGPFDFSRPTTHSGASGYGRRRAWPKWYKLNRLQAGELLGTVVAKQVRCGTGSCRCRSGQAEHLHGPYYYRLWRDETGTQRKAYIKRAELEEVQAAIARRKERLKRERARRNRHMRRGMGGGKAAHVWRRRRRQPSTLARLDELTRTLDRFLGKRG